MGPSTIFLLYTCLLWIEWCPPTVVRVILFIQSVESDANLFQNHPHRHIQNVSPAIWAPLSPANLTHEINHHSSHVWRPSLMKVFILDLAVLTEGGIWAPDTSHKG